MYIAHICSELAPIAKVGGLADVVYGLAKAHAKVGHQVEIILPKYARIDYSFLTELKVDYSDLWSFEGYQRYSNTIWSAKLDSIKIFLIESSHPGHYFDREDIYGYEDDVDRFIYFVRTALEYLFKSIKHPDILHLHDWPTALAPAMYQDMYLPLGMPKCRTILTIHNLEHQGRCSPRTLSKAGLRAEGYLSPDKMQDPYSPITINLLKGGIQYADAVTTVSPTYEKEIQTPEGGCGLDAVMRKASSKLSGILNGIDPDVWDPTTDSHLVKRYETTVISSDEDFQKIARAKQENKRFLQTYFGMEETEAPLVTCITRLVRQKGTALIKECLLRTLELKGQFILLGSSAPPEIEREFIELQRLLATNRHAVIHLNYDEKLAHLLYAGSDLIVIPSLFEPCGLTQIIGLRYGTIPLVRSTGGLVDTVFDIDTSLLPIEQRNGFTFDFPDVSGVHWALDRAINYKQTKPELWQKLMRNAMSADYSWDRAAKEYLQIYEGAPSLRRALLM